MPIKFQCACGQAYRVPDESAGKKIKCKKCDQPLQVPNGSKTASKKPASGASDPFSMDFGLEEDFTPGELPPRRKKESAPGSKNKKKSGTNTPQSSKMGLYIGIGITAVLLLGIGGFFLFSSGSSGSSAPEPAVVQYATFSHELGQFKVKYPSDWEQKSGGGQGGRPPFASFEDGTADISIRHNLKGVSIADMASLPSGGPIIPGAEEEEDPPAKAVHEFLGQQQYANDYRDFEELPGKEFTVPYGDGWLSEFTATVGLGGKIKAYRLTLTGTQFQYNVICKCPEFQWEEYEPIFMEVIKSINR